MSFTIPEILELLAQQTPLNDNQADFMFAELMNGNMTEAQAGAFLMGLRIKGEDSTDLAAGVRTCVAHARKIPGYDGTREEPVFDTVGTGATDSAVSTTPQQSPCSSRTWIQGRQTRQPRPVLFLRIC